MHAPFPLGLCNLTTAYSGEREAWAGDRFVPPAGPARLGALKPIARFSGFDFKMPSRAGTGLDLPEKDRAPCEF